MSDRGPAPWLIMVLVAVAAACGHPEQVVVDKYFGSVNQHDNQTLSSFASVSFDKQVDKWTITEETPESKSPAPLAELLRKHKDLEAQVAENQKAARAYNLEHFTEVDQVKEIHGRGGKIPPKLQAAAAEWDKFNQKDRELRKALSEAKDALEKEKKEVMLSVGPVDNVESLSGEMSTKQLGLTLVVAGKPQNYTMTLRKYDMSSGAKGPRVISRWIVTGLTPKA